MSLSISLSLSLSLSFFHSFRICIGTIGAIGGNNIGVTSINPDSSKFDFLIGKGLKDTGSGTTAKIIKAVEWCYNNGADIISMSIGCDGCFDAAENDAMQTVYDNGVLIVAAAGNSGNTVKSYPASYKSVMSVGATNSNYNIVGFSQKNDQVEISAPGKDIKSTTTTGGSGTTYTYETWDGTSMATPHVAGVAALVWSHFPSCTNKQIRNVLLASALDRGATGCDNEYGYGIVQAKDAYDLLLANGCNAYTSVTDNGGCGQTWTSTSPTPPTPPSPTPPSPTPPSPTPTCSPTENNVKVTLLTDDYGEETEWKIKDSNRNIVLELGSTEVLASNTEYVVEECIPNNACRFIIKDSWGDGICCDYGIGFYTIHLNGIQVATGDGQFGTREFVDFC